LSINNGVHRLAQEGLVVFIIIQMYLAGSAEIVFAFYEGSKMIATVFPGGLDAFQKLEEREKVHWRQLAIDTIGKKCANSGQVAVVAGHFMFWPEEEEAGWPVYTQNDLDTFTHILYLDVPAEVVVQRRIDDTERSRPSTSVTNLREWQQAEKTQLRHLCRQQISPSLHSTGLLYRPSERLGSLYPEALENNPRLTLISLALDLRLMRS
jgi:hypothetical protein